MGAGTVIMLLETLVNGVHVSGSVPPGHRSFGTQLLAVTQICVPAETMSVHVFRHGLGAMTIEYPDDV